MVGNKEQVHGGDVRCVVKQEGAPAPGRRSTSLDHVLRDAGLSDLEAELEQLAMDARRSPQRIFRAQILRLWFGHRHTVGYLVRDHHSHLADNLGIFLRVRRAELRRIGFAEAQPILGAMGKRSSNARCSENRCGRWTCRPSLLGAPPAGSAGSSWARRGATRLSPLGERHAAPARSARSRIF
jgi:hypothetical protein